MKKFCILSAGKGTRNSNIVGLHKALLPLENKPVISYIIDKLDKQVEIVEEGSRSLDEVSHIVDAVPSNDKQELQNANEGNWQLVEAITGGGRKLRIHSSKLNLKLHNVGKTDWAGEVKSDTPWVKVTEKLKIDCLTASTLPLSLNLSELQVGTNTGYVIIGNDRIPVWATLRVINNFTFV